MIHTVSANRFGEFWQELESMMPNKAKTLFRSVFPSKEESLIVLSGAKEEDPAATLAQRVKVLETAPVKKEDAPAPPSKPPEYPVLPPAPRQGLSLPARIALIFALYTAATAVIYGAQWLGYYVKSIELDRLQNETLGKLSLLEAPGSLSNATYSERETLRQQICQNGLDQLTSIQQTCSRLPEGAEEAFEKVGQVRLAVQTACWNTNIHLLHNYFSAQGADGLVQDLENTHEGGKTFDDPLQYLPREERRLEFCSAKLAERPDEEFKRACGHYQDILLGVYGSAECGLASFKENEESGVKEWDQECYARCMNEYEKVREIPQALDALNVAVEDYCAQPPSSRAGKKILRDAVRHYHPDKHRQEEEQKTIHDQSVEINNMRDLLAKDPFYNIYCVFHPDFSAAKSDMPK